MIRKGKKALKDNEDLIAPRDQKPWQNIEDLNPDGSFKEKETKSMASSISDAKKLDEADAREYDDLLGGIRDDDNKKSTQLNTAHQMEPETQTASTSKQTTTAPPRVKSVIVKIDDKKEEANEFVVKRQWAWKAETDEENVYYPNRRTNCFESIRNLTEWTKKNLVDFEDDKMFETLFTTEHLFEDPGLESHPAADVYLNKVRASQNAGRRSNTFEFGFRCLARRIFLGVFKDKCYGLVNRNFSALRGWSKRRLMENLGKFMDKVMAMAERVEYPEEDDVRYELNRFEVEKIKDEFLNFTTENKAGSYEIDIYCKDVSISENEWLLHFLKFNSFAWENLTMMRAKKRENRNSRLQWHFRNRFADEYYEGISLLNELFRNPNILAPGSWSKIFM